MLGCKKHRLESRFLGEISITSDMQMTPPLWQKVKKNFHFDESERGELKSRVTIYGLDILPSKFGISLLFHVQF